MPATPFEWDEKHRSAAKEARLEPEPLVRELLPLLPSGPALDVACGRGRHTLLLAERGNAVTAVDWSPVALDILRHDAASKRLSVQRMEGPEAEILPARSGIVGICRDLHGAALPPESFSLIVCVQYLERSLMGGMERALKPGGAILFETFTAAQAALSGVPRNPAYLLERGELRNSFPRLEIVFYRELTAQQGIASLLARKPCTPN